MNVTKASINEANLNEEHFDKALLDKVVLDKALGFVTLFNQLDKGAIDQVDSLYTADIYFIDPVHRIAGLDAFKHYLCELYQSVEHCQFEMNELVGDDTNMVIGWTMELLHPRLNRGKPFRIEGCSHIKWRGERIHYHRDYFDLGAMLYEHLPLLGRLVRAVKSRLSTTGEEG